MQLTSTVFRVPRVRGANAYLRVGANGLTLIDSGLPGSAPVVLRFIQSLGYSKEDLRHILLTHGHPDHAGSAKALREATGARVLIHTADTCISSAGNLMVQCPGLPRSLIPPPLRVSVDGLLEEGCSADGLLVLHTPGHTPGGVSLLLEDDGVLFTGDLLTQRGSHVSRSAPFPGTRLDQYHASLERVSTLPARIACFGHGDVITENVGDTLRGAAEWYASSPRWRRMLQRLPGPFRPGIQTGYRFR